MLAYDLVPPSGDATPDTRWILMLHGLGDSKHGWQPIAGELDLDAGWIFAQAPDVYYSGWSWFDLQLPDIHPDPDTVRRSLHLLRELLLHLETDRGIPAERLVVMGFSQGCLMAMELALTHDRLFAGVLGISGWIAGLERFPGAFGPAAPRQRILMTHGIADPVIPIAATRPQAARLQDLGLDLDWREYLKGHHLDMEEELGDMREFLRG